MYVYRNLPSFDLHNVQQVPRMDKRVITAAKLGYRRCIVPQSAVKDLSALSFEEMKILGCRNLKEVIKQVFARV